MFSWRFLEPIRYVRAGDCRRIVACEILPVFLSSGSPLQGHSPLRHSAGRQSLPLQDLKTC